MRVSYMKPGRRAREERLVSREFPDYKTDDRGEPSDASAEEVRTYVSHRFVVAAVSILQRLQHCIGYGAPSYCRGPALEQEPQRWRLLRRCQESIRNRSKQHF